MSKIKKFFSRKKDEAAFKLKLGSGGLGQGRALNAPAPQPSSSSKKPSGPVYVPPKHKELSAEARTAAAAALARIERKDNKDFNTSLAAIKAQAKRELEAERQLREQESAAALPKTSVTSVENKNLACQGVFFRCPMVSEEVLPKKEWKVKIKEFLYQQLEFDRGLTACLIICNCNVNEKSEECVQTLSKYLENIINHPDEEKYFKIRMSNRIFCEKVRYVEGALEFLHAAGFREMEIDNEPFLIWSKDNMETDTDLPALLEALHNSEVIPLTLDRNIKVLLPSQVRRAALPDDFYRISPEEIKREQQLRAEAIEQAQVLKTKAMREREEQRNLRMYRYALIRVKFPNGIYIQGTFNVYEKISDVYEFVQSCLSDEEMEFSVTIMGEGRFTAEDMDKTLYDLRLIPNVTFLFTPHHSSTTASEISLSDTNYLKEDLLMLVQSMDA